MMRIHAPDQARRGASIHQKHRESINIHQESIKNTGEPIKSIKTRRRACARARADASPHMMGVWRNREDTQQIWLPHQKSGLMGVDGVDGETFCPASFAHVLRTSLARSAQ